MVEKEINGYIFNHTTAKYLEIYIFNYLGHPIHDLIKLFENNNLKYTKKSQQDKVNGLTRIYVYYTDNEKVKSLYKEINEKFKIKPITYYDTIKVLRTLLKNFFR
jgi:hypothetical protein